LKGRERKIKISKEIVQKKKTAQTKARAGAIFLTPSMHPNLRSPSFRPLLHPLLGSSCVVLSVSLAPLSLSDDWSAAATAAAALS